MIHERVQLMTPALQSLLDAPSHRISNVLAQKLAHAAVPGVYLISAPSQPESIVYVGRTKTKTVLGRLNDHCRLSTPSDLSGMLLRYPDQAQDARSYDIRWVSVEDDISRAQLELFAIAVLKPPFNRYI